MFLPANRNDHPTPGKEAFPLIGLRWCYRILQFLRRYPKLRAVNDRKSSQDPQQAAHPSTSLGAGSAYATAGVNIDLADTLKSGLKEKVRKTLRREVLGAIGGFGGLFALDLKKHKRPVLVSSMDGVGTKLKIAVAMNKHDTVGQDLVNHCVNDIAVLGAEPLYFLDYIGMGKLAPHVFNQIIDGLAKACAEAGCALIGGETAQMPGMYAEGEYDLVGTIVGVVEKDRIIDGSRIRARRRDHRSGFELVCTRTATRWRGKSCSSGCGCGWTTTRARLGCTFGEELLKVHRSYWPVVQEDSRFEIRRFEIACMASPTSPAAGFTTTFRVCCRRTALPSFAAGHGTCCRSSNCFRKTAVWLTMKPIAFSTWASAWC